MKKAANRVVVVTGAGNGIGLHLAAALLRDGYRVAGLDLSGENLAALENIYPGRLAFCRCDVTSDADVATAVGTVVEKWGGIDILVNNACLCLFQPFELGDIGTIRREFEVNYFGYVRMIAAVLPHMKARGGGIIHNLSSGVGVTGFPGISGYVSTKGAIEGLTRTLALELGRYGICVNLMHPPLTATASSSPLGVPPRMMADPAAVGRKLAARILSTRPVITTDIRSAVYLFLSYRYPRFVGALFGRLAARPLDKASP